MIRFTSASHGRELQDGIRKLYLLPTANLDPATVRVSVKLK
jgi:hypothetical protein